MQQYFLKRIYLKCFIPKRKPIFPEQNDGGCKMISGMKLKALSLITSENEIVLNAEWHTSGTSSGLLQHHCFDLFIKSAVFFLEKTAVNWFPHTYNVWRSILSALISPVSPSVLFPHWFLLGADKGSEEMRTATILAWGQIGRWPENLFTGCCPCICRTLKLLSQLWLVVRDYIHFPPSPCFHYRECEKAETFMRVNSMCFSLIYIPLSVCVFFVFERGWKRESWRRQCQSIHALENSRSLFHVLPTTSQTVPNQSIA